MKYENEDNSIEAALWRAERYRTYVRSVGGEEYAVVNLPATNATRASIDRDILATEVCRLRRQVQGMSIAARRAGTGKRT